MDIIYRTVRLPLVKVSSAMVLIRHTSESGREEGCDRPYKMTGCELEGLHSFQQPRQVLKSLAAQSMRKIMLSIRTPTAHLPCP